jgi:hypothetical protein
MGSLTLQTLREPILLPPWVCVRGGSPNPRPLLQRTRELSLVSRGGHAGWGVSTDTADQGLPPVYSSWSWCALHQSVSGLRCSPDRAWGSTYPVSTEGHRVSTVCMCVLRADYRRSHTLMRSPACPLVARRGGARTAGLAAAGVRPVEDARVAVLRRAAREVQALADMVRGSRWVKMVRGNEASFAADGARAQFLPQSRGSTALLEAHIHASLPSCT